MKCIKFFALMIAMVAGFACFTSCSDDEDELENVDLEATSYYADLGLSVLWCTYNYGAVNPTESGGYYTHSQAMEITKNNTTTNRLPTKEEILELEEKCKGEMITMNGVKGVRVTGPNGNTIFLPKAGYYERTDEKLPDGRYWASTPSGSEGYFYHLELIGEDNHLCLSDKNGIYRMPLRMVKSNKK